MNIFCLKVGTKFSSNYVNKLYNMIKLNTTEEFSLSCITDNSSGIDNNVKIIDHVDFGVDAWWNKMVFFDECRFNGPGLFFDLDIIIQGNIDDLYEPKPFVRLLKTTWVDLEELKRNTIGNVQRFCSINSSVMCWGRDTKRQPIYNFFIANKDKITSTFTGIDSYIEHRFPNMFSLYDDVACSYEKNKETTKKIILFDGSQPLQEDICDERIQKLWI